MTDKAWKQFERRVAKIFGGVRRGPTGDDGPDILTDAWSIQCKLRKSIPAWLHSALWNAVRGATGEQIGFAVIKRSGRGYTDDDALVVLRLADFVWLAERWEEKE